MGRNLQRAILVGLFVMGGLSLAGEFIVKWADTQGPTHPSVVMAENLSKILEEKSGGRIKIQVYPAGQFGSAREMIEGVSLGMHEVIPDGPAMVAQFVPSIGITESPYVWRDADHMVKVFNGPIGEEFSKELIQKTGMRIIGALYYGARHITSTSREIRHVKDLEGFKLRTPESDIYVAMADAWGAKATPSSFSELYLALRQNVVDGQENPIPTIVSAKFNEVQKYLVLTGHIVGTRIVLINEAFWQSLGKELQDMFKEELDKAGEWHNKVIKDQEQAMLAELEKGGMIVIRPDIEEFRKPVVESLPAKFEFKWGKGTWDRIQAVK
ncbi:MAG: sialic acid TRAP transporter substrate-binding protein SiaP [Planctomycetota bacterium]|jgi:tripartite ATP-independent transporter DctP family solute receptor|nr:sialic acid TRAP transporter substrate-binding protein SiaP [Planctomycetota bacterium]